MPRLGYARFTHETNAFNPVLTEVRDFEGAHLVEGAALARGAAPGGVEVPRFGRRMELSGFVEEAQRSGADTVPLLSAWAIPSGPLAPGAFAILKERLLRHVRAAGPLDGMMVALHGAMTLPEDHEPEATLLEAIKDALGPGVPLVVSYDLHAHLTPRKLAACDGVVAYHTNPHRDHAATGARAAALLLKLVSGCRYARAWRRLPMVLGGGTTLDFLPTMGPVFWRMWRMLKRPGVLSADLFMSHFWHDAPDLGWCVLVQTEGDQAAADALADELAERLWAVRDVAKPDFLDATQAIDLARRATWRRRLGTICLSDASDNVAAGAVGENTHLLRALLTEATDLRCHVPLRDPVVARAMADTPLGTWVDTEMGGRFAPEFHPPIPVAGRLVWRDLHPAMGHRARLDCGHVQLVLTEHAPLAMLPAFFEDAGLRVWAADITVVKAFFHFRWYFLRSNRQTVYVRTRGTTDFDLPLTLPHVFPVHPRDEIADWRVEDRRRRGVGAKAQP